MIRAIIVAALLLGGATGPLLVADTAFADHPVPDPIWLTVDSGADLVLSRPTFWDSACHPPGRHGDRDPTPGPRDGFGRGGIEHGQSKSKIR
jgi:hypothetical protein